MALVVDDEEGVRQVAGSMLLHLGFEVSTVTNGWEAIEAVRKQGDVLRVVLLDVTMPGISGEEAFRRIHELRPDLPVILMSGYNEQQVTSSLAGQGLAGFLKKPFTVESFSERLRDALET
jgi:CheY-like chemotaxis protein